MFPLELNHGREKGLAHFELTGADKRSNRNLNYEILLTYDPWRSTPQSPAEHGSGLGYRIRNQVGRLNHTHA